MKNILFILLFSNCQIFGQSIDVAEDSTILFFSDFRKPPNWIYAEANLRANYNPYPKDMNMESAVGIIKTAKDYSALRPAVNWCIENYKTTVPVLLNMLLDTTYVGLTTTKGLIFSGRPITAKYQFQSGTILEIVSEDIFTISGRSSHILNKLTNEHFLIVKSSTLFPELELYKRLWRSWFRRL